jgi:hypothetical protein
VQKVLRLAERGAASFFADAHGFVGCKPDGLWNARHQADLTLKKTPPPAKRRIFQAEIRSVFLLDRPLLDHATTWLCQNLALPADRNMFSILRSWPHGHVAAVLGVMRSLGFDRLMGKAGDRMRDLIMALVVCRLLDPASKLATARMLNPESAANSLPEMMQFSGVSENDLYSALDWLVQNQPNIERTLAGRHLDNGTLVLYDVSSSFVEGHSCELAQLGYSRDGKKGTLQIVYGLLCSADGCPVAVEVFDGNTADPKTLSAQISKLKERFHLAHVILVGDRGMITQARIDQELNPAGFDWISALRGDAVKQLFARESFQLSLFEERDLAGITTPEYPGERLILCRNPELSKHRAKKREELLCATEAALSKIAQRVQRAKNPLSGKEKIGLAVGQSN